MQDNLLDVSEIRKLIEINKKVVFVHGNFNVLHAGHVRFLKFASENGDVLVVGVNEDSDSTHVPQNHRIHAVAALSCVNYAFIMDDLEKALTALKPDVIVKGSENQGEKTFETLYAKKLGIKLVYSSGESNFSSYEILKKEFTSASEASFRLPTDYISRREIDKSKLLAIIEKFKKLKIVVIGDLIVDEYITCDPIGMSQEDPTIVVSPVARDKFLGGAGIVAAHAKGLGAEVTFVSVTGGDEARDFALDKLSEYDVRSELLVDESRPTTLKQRYRAKGKTLLRVSHLRQHHISPDLSDELLVGLNKLINHGVNLIILSDFNYGVLTPELVERISAVCLDRGVCMVADSQTSSQVGDISRFRNMMLVTPTEHEIRVALQDSDSGLVELAKKLIKKSNADNVFITLGADGVFIFNKQGVQSSVGTDEIPALNVNPKDVSGAGDCMLTSSSMALVSGASIWESAYLGSLAAAVQVSRVGNIPISASEIKKVITS